MRSRAAPATVWTFRAAILLTLICSVGFIIYAVILENPPSTALPLGLLIIGIVGAVTGLVGILGSCFYKSCCMTLYLVLGVVVTLAELGITLALFFNTSNIVDELANSAADGGTPTADQTQSAENKVKGGRWFFLVVVLLQAAAVAVGLVLRLCIYPKQQDFHEGDFGEGGAQHAASMSQIQMEALKQSVAGRASGATNPESSQSFYAGSRKISRSVTRKMAAKYGEHAHAPEYQKGWFARTFGL